MSDLFDVPNADPSMDEMFAGSIPEHPAGEKSKLRYAAIHTSDRGSFKSCRRKWAWSSHMGRFLEPTVKASPLWFGSAFHYALEDVHGYQRYASGAEALLDYARVTQTLEPKSLPWDFEELKVLGVEMMNYYDLWRKSRKDYPTYVVDGIPQCEVRFEIELPLHADLLEAAELDMVVYRGTFDRIAIDPDTGLLWIVEYKTAKMLETRHLANDPQVSAYCWAASVVYDIPVAGVIYQQHLKESPRVPRMLSNGTLSLDTKQKTTHRMYRQALLDIYGDPKVFPNKYIAVLNELAKKEGPESDAFIRRDRIDRSRMQIESEGIKILMEAADMIDPNLRLYPSPGRMTCLMCNFLSPCISVDDGSDFESELNDPTLYRKREQESNAWAALVQHPIKRPIHILGADRAAALIANHTNT